MVLTRSYPPRLHRALFPNHLWSIRIPSQFCYATYYSLSKLSHIAREHNKASRCRRLSRRTANNDNWGYCVTCALSASHSKVIIVVTLRVSFVFTQECASKFCGSQLPTCGMLLVLYVVVLCLLKKIMGRKEEGNAPPCTKIILRQRHNGMSSRLLTWL